MYKFVSKMLLMRWRLIQYLETNIIDAVPKLAEDPAGNEGRQGGKQLAML